MNDGIIQPGQRTWARIARDFLIWMVLLWWFFGSLGTPYLRIAGSYRYADARYIGFGGMASLPCNAFGKSPLIVLVPLKNSVGTDVWQGLMAIKKFAFD